MYQVILKFVFYIMVIHYQMIIQIIGGMEVLFIIQV